MSVGKCDFCVVGGGMVGAATALGIAKLGYQVVIVEAKLPEPIDMLSPPDIRVSAINPASEKLLKGLGAWNAVPQQRIAPLEGMEVWELQGIRTTFYGDSVNQSSLGYIIENNVVQQALHSELNSFKNVHWVTGNVITDVEFGIHNRLVFKDGTEISCRFVVGADGANSIIRQKHHIGTQGWQYKQHAMGINIKLEEGHDCVTWQQFRPEGPVAFLPLFDNYASLIWYDSPSTIKKLLTLDKHALKQQIHECFPDKLGNFDILQFAAFPLTRMHANCYVKEHTVLIGDAAHTINPLAGQGVNLGFKDVKSLLGYLTEAMSDKEIITALSRYETSRRCDNLVMMSTMDFFYKTFSNDVGPLKMIRNGIFLMAEKIHPVKNQVMKYAMGLR